MQRTEDSQWKQGCGGSKAEVVSQLKKRNEPIQPVHGSMGIEETMRHAGQKKSPTAFVINEAFTVELFTRGT